LAVPDLHAPWTDINAVTSLYSAIERFKPSVLIQLGDLYDMYAHTRFARSHDLCTPKEEMAEARKFAEGFWKQCQRIAGRKCRYIQILGNHDDRPSKRIADKYPEIASILGIDHLFKFPGVETILDSRTELQIDGNIYTHGHYTKHGQHAAYYGKSVIHGHTHRAAVIYIKLYDRIIWELDAGHLAQDDSEPLSYTPTKTNKWTKGHGEIDELGPRWVAD